MANYSKVKLVFSIFLFKPPFLRRVKSPFIQLIFNYYDLIHLIHG